MQVHDMVFGEIISKGCPQIFIRVCLLDYIEGLSIKLFIGVCPLIYIEGLIDKFQYRILSNDFSKTNIFVFKTVFHTWKMHV